MNKRFKRGAIIGFFFVLWHLFLVSSKWYLGPAGDYTYLLMVLVATFGILVQYRDERVFDQERNAGFKYRFKSAMSLSLSLVVTYCLGTMIIHFLLYPGFTQEIVELKRQLLMESVAMDPSQILSEDHIENQLRLLGSRFKFPGFFVFFFLIPAFQTTFISLLMAAISSKK